MELGQRSNDVYSMKCKVGFVCELVNCEGRELHHIAVSLGNKGGCLRSLSIRDLYLLGLTKEFGSCYLLELHEGDLFVFYKNLVKFCGAYSGLYLLFAYYNKLSYSVSQLDIFLKKKGIERYKHNIVWFSINSFYKLNFFFFLCVYMVMRSLRAIV